MHKFTPRALVLLGPTASGKTALALELAKLISIEIISLDSALVYKGMDIGTAKPSKEELAKVYGFETSHFKDVLDEVMLENPGKWAEKLHCNTHPHPYRNVR